MIGQAERRGLEFFDSADDFAPDSAPEDWTIRDEFKGVYRLSGRNYRPIGDLQRQAVGLELAVNEKIHESTVARLSGGGSFINRDNLAAVLESGADVFHERELDRLTSLTSEPAKIMYGSFGGNGENIKQSDALAAECAVKDYSDRGARVFCKNAPQLETGERVSLETASAARREALVRWQNDKTVGLQFLQPPAA